MRRTAIVLAAIACIATAMPCAAQQPTSIQRAQEVLVRITSLIDSIQAKAAQRAARQAAQPPKAEWIQLFDGKSLAGWKQTDFTGGAPVHVDPGFRGGDAAIVVDNGSTLSGFNWTGDVPRTNYEVQLDVMKLLGSDFMCGLTFPVAESYASLILGGWGGTVVGISCIDFHDASENPSTKYITLDKDRWYHVRLVVTPARLAAWLDDRKVVDEDITGRTINLRHGEISKSVPLGIATYQTQAAYRNIRLRRLAEPGK